MLRTLVTTLLLVPLFVVPLCNEGAVWLDGASPTCSAHDSDAGTDPAPVQTEANDCCPACDAFLATEASAPAPQSISLASLPGCHELPTAARAAFARAVDRPPDGSSRPGDNRNVPLLI